MIRKKTNLTPGPPSRAKSQEPFPWHHLESLLRTIRHIAQHEDALCEILHEAKGPSGLSTENGNELRKLIEELPVDDYVDDFAAVRALLPVARASQRPAARAASNAAASKEASPKKLPRKRSTPAGTPVPKKKKLKRRKSSK